MASPVGMCGRYQSIKWSCAVGCRTPTLIVRRRNDPERAAGRLKDDAVGVPQQNGTDRQIPYIADMRIHLWQYGVVKVGRGAANDKRQASLP